MAHEKHPKTKSLEAVMRHQHLSKTIFDALDSPPGSSKRASALAIMKAMHRNMGVYNVGAYTGQGGMSVGTAPTARNPLQVQTQAPAMPTLRVQNQPIQQPPLKVQPSTPTAPSPASSAMPSTIGSTIQPAANGQGIQPAATGQIQGSLPKIILPAAYKPIEQTQPPAALAQEESTPGSVETWYQGLSPADKEKWKPLYEAVQAGVGKETFAMQMMDDINSLKKLPGFENVPMEALPKGSSLVRQVADLQKRKKEEFNIDSLQNNLQRLQERGQTIESNLTDYIATRDEYLKKIDSMIQGTKQSMLNLDMANPYVSKNVNQYMNYLLIMKGRQQKRYTDFLNAGILQHDLEVKRAQTAFNNASKRFSEDFATMKDVTEEDYKRWKTMLEDMYTNLEGREKKELELAKLREQYYKAHAENAGSFILTPEQKNDIVNYERRLGRGLKADLWNTIISVFETMGLNKQDRLDFIDDLKSEFQRNPNLTDNEILDLLEEFTFY